MEYGIANVFIVLLGVILGIGGWLVSVRLAQREMVLVEHTMERTLVQPSRMPAVGCVLKYQGKPLKNFHDNTFVITNQGLHAIRNLDLVLQFSTPEIILQAVLVNGKACKAQASLQRGSKRVSITADVLEAQRFAGTALELHIFSNQALGKINVAGGSPTWRSQYRERTASRDVAPSMSTPNVSVALEGPIGVGKTTLARFLQTRWNADLRLETFEENPFLAGFYADRQRYAFQAQLFFLLARLECLDNDQPKDQPRVSDYIFAKNNLFAQLNLGEDELRLYQHLYDRVTQQVPPPDLVIYVKADVPSLLRRIEKRNRAFEKSIDRTYLERLSQAYEDFFRVYEAAPVLTLDTSNLDIVHNGEDRTAVFQYIESAIGASQPVGAASPDAQHHLESTKAMVPA